MKYAKTLSTVILLLLTSASISFGQVQSSVTASGTVLEPITVTNTGLSFGTSIFPGRDEVVAIGDAGAAQWDVDGETGKEITITFSALPSDLTHDTDGTTKLPITYSGSDAGHNTSDDPATATTFDPSSGATTTLGSTSGLLYLYLGGTVTPSNTQKQGAYSANITVDFAYTGN